MPDAKGRVPPATAMGGQIHWSIEGGEQQGLIGRAEQVDRTSGMSLTSACMECCPDSWYSFWITPGSISGFPGDTAQFSANQQNQTCYSELLDPFTVSNPAWSSTVPSVATCDQSGLGTAINPGQTSIRGQWTVRSWDSDFDGMCHRYLEQAIANALCDVNPNISSISPAFGIPATIVQVSIDGSGFNTGSTVTVGGSGITVSGITLRSSTQITANFSISANAASGSVSVTVTSNNRTSNSAAFSVRIPHHLRVISDNTGTPTCPGGSPTVVRDIEYEVVDVNGNLIPDLTVMENFVNVTANTCNSSQPQPTSCTQVGPSGLQFVDELTVGCPTTGSSCGYNVTDQWQWCPSGRAPVTLASLSFVVRNNQILVNGATQFSPGTNIYP